MMTKDEVRAHLADLIDGNDEKAAEEFVLKNFAVLPEEFQKDLLFAFYTEALEKEAAKDPIAMLQAEGLIALDQLEMIKSSLSSTS